jgi:hypothetical protein
MTDETLDLIAAETAVAGLEALCAAARVGIAKLREDRHREAENLWLKRAHASVDRPPILSDEAADLLFNLGVVQASQALGPRAPVPLPAPMTRAAIELHHHGLAEWLDARERTTHFASEARSIDISLFGQVIHMRRLAATTPPRAKAELEYLNKNRARVIDGKRRRDERWVMTANWLENCGAARFLVMQHGSRETVFGPEAYRAADELELLPFGRRLLAQVGEIGKKSAARPPRKKPAKPRAARKAGQK